MNTHTTERIRELTAEGARFVHATVVRAQVPSSARPGDAAIVLEDGSIEGFVGGQCAESSVRTAALDALASGRSTLLRVLPDGADAFPETPGAQIVVNPCLSGGALEIFLEPMVPAPVVHVVGDTPVARALVAIAQVLDYQVEPWSPGVDVVGTSALVVASHGRHEVEAIRAALDGGTGYIALVASRRRGAAVLDELGLTGPDRDRVSTPAGLDLGARTAPEVALSILAEVVTAVRTAAPNARTSARTAPLQAVDPVCGMTVTVLPDTPHLTVGGEDFWFCMPHCRDRYAETAGLPG
jgi:xanthine dehydrogenase accessory factor